VSGTNIGLSRFGVFWDLVYHKWLAAGSVQVRVSGFGLWVQTLAFRDLVFFGDLVSFGIWCLVGFGVVWDLVYHQWLVAGPTQVRVSGFGLWLQTLAFWDLVYHKWLVARSADKGARGLPRRASRCLPLRVSGFGFRVEG